jgi:hypothetical protein
VQYSLVFTYNFAIISNRTVMSIACYDAYNPVTGAQETVAGGPVITSLRIVYGRVVII